MTWVMIIGGIVLALILGFVALGLTDPMRLRQKELVGRSREQIEKQIERILMVNRSMEPRIRFEPAPFVAGFPSPTWRPSPDGNSERRMTLLPKVLHEAYYGAPSETLDRPEARALVTDAAVALAEKRFRHRGDLMAAVRLYEGDADDAPLIDGDVPYEQGDRAISVLLAVASQAFGAGLSVEELRSWWSLGDGPLDPRTVEKLEAFARTMDEQIMRVLDDQEALLATAGNGLPSEMEALRPRFATPGRAARLQALLEQVAQQTDVDVPAIEKPEQLLFPVDGLPYPVELVLDLGSHVAPVHSKDLDGEQHTPEELHGRAITNLATIARLPAIPDDRVELIEDPNDHGAAHLLLLPKSMNAGQSCLAVSPGHGLLLLFPETPELVDEARALFDELLDDPPVPEPVRVSADGFEAIGWPS